MLDEHMQTPGMWHPRMTHRQIRRMSQAGSWSQIQVIYRRSQLGTPSTQPPPPLKTCPCRRSSYRSDLHMACSCEAEIVPMFH